MKKYWSFFRMRFLGSLQYRAAAWAGIATQFAWGFMKLLMYRAFYEAGPAAFPMEFSQLATYIWLQQAFLMLFNTWRYDNDIFESITTGGVAYELSRPVPVYSMWFVKCIASRVASTALRCLPVLVVAFLLPAPYRLNTPESAGVFLVFLLSLAAASALVMALQMLVYSTAIFSGSVPQGCGTNAVCSNAEPAAPNLLRHSGGQCSYAGARPAGVLAHCACGMRYTLDAPLAPPRGRAGRLK